MASNHIFTARNTRPGQKVRQQALDLGTLAQDHVITSTEHIYATDADGLITTDYYVIKTNYGVWSFSPHELVTFPRRPDNSRRDWRKAPAPPTPLQLAIGDILPNRFGFIDPEVPEDDQAQHVISITRNRTRPNVVQVNTHSREDDLLSVAFLPDEPVLYPRRPADRPSGYDRFNPKLVGYGPYLATDPTTADEYLLFYVAHPAGRGRWPSYLDTPINIGNGTYLAKPPAVTKIKEKDKKTKTVREPWPTFVGTDPYRRHFKDPAHGKLGGTPAVDPARREQAERAYADYRARADA